VDPVREEASVEEQASAAPSAARAPEHRMERKTMMARSIVGGLLASSLLLGGCYMPPWQPATRAYVWVPGHWTVPPRGYVWVPGHWETQANGNVWVDAYWRQN
jgi:YXWGXW repeat-containing protein